MADQPSYVRYSDDVETMTDDEWKVIDGIVASMTHES